LAPRCAAKNPFGLVSIERVGARPPASNGCGPENGIKVPVIKFAECCNRHDLCYDDCSQTWEDCNNAFRMCNHLSCTKEFPTKTNESWYDESLRWGCHQLADTYADATNSYIGVWAFNGSTAERCDCRCPSGMFDCGKACKTECSDDDPTPLIIGPSAGGILRMLNWVDGLEK